jgi:3-hydroxy acid dehydrogenase / malonic semialdehyde reductase
MINKIALITGSTSGIGEATAHQLAQRKIKLVLCGRRPDRLDSLRRQLSRQTAVHTLCFDVRSQDQTLDAIQSLPEEYCAIDILINNAGNAHGLDPIDQASLEDINAMLDINVKGLLYVTKAILPAMVERGQGHIINVGSIAGKESYFNGNVYCASKAAVDSLTRGMRIDLLSKGIMVSVIHPGLVETEFSLVRFKGDQARAKSVYQGMEPLTAQDVAEAIDFILTRPKHVNVAEILLLPKDQASATNVRRA